LNEGCFIPPNPEPRAPKTFKAARSLERDTDITFRHTAFNEENETAAMKAVLASRDGISGCRNLALLEDEKMSVLLIGPAVSTAMN
jgi:hypothetical protein